MVRPGGTTVFATLLFLSSSLLLSGCTTPEGNAQDGKRWYRMHNCYACHGDNGDDGKGPRIGGINMSYRSFVSRLRNAETQIMPEYSKERINDQDAADILAFLQLTKKN